ncbi:VirB4 family type IV secretion system protein [Peribacillus asahii]|uniref:VirB4 family type IV secretion system protein n=1 Tax=Peribacillus asahii TaxID=228899 RepID=UPI00207AB348|nr:DUF87 domain-containing protein [Peribacillus asahii]USK72640.1 ATP-binding protein [Peribacillus asahii]USK72756.1 ATP-binding protein [Peribacillus asahii]
MFKNPYNQLIKKKPLLPPQAMTLRDMIAPAPIFQEEMTYMRLGENYVRTFLVIDFPRNPKGNFLSKLYRFKGNLTISTHLVPKPNDEYIKQTERSISELSTELNGKQIMRMKPSRKLELEQKLKAAENTLEKLMSGDNKSIFHVHMYLHLQASSLDELERATKRLKVNAFKRGLRIEPAIADMITAFRAILPTMDNSIPEMTYRNFDTEAASSLFPFDESELFHNKGIIKGINLTTDSLVLIDQKLLPSHNEFIVGQTGMGKTFYLIKDLLRKWMNGDRVFVIDPEGEISKICKKVGGQVIKVSPMSRSVVNILDIKATMDSADIDADDQDEAEVLPLMFQKIQRLKIFFKLIKKNMEIVELAQLEKAIIATYDKKEIGFDTDFSRLGPTDFPILEDLYNEIEDKEKYSHLQDFREILFMYVHGSNSRMFNGHTNVDLRNDFICFNLKELEEESDSQAAAMYNAISFMWDEITSKHEQFTWLNVDEAHTIADPDNPRAMKFLYQIWKRIRKYNGGATAATQQIADFLSAQEGHRNYGQAIIGNSYSQLILPLKEKDVADLRNNEILKLSEEEELIISKLRQGEGIYVVGNNRVHMKVDHTPAEMKLINPVAYERLYGEKAGAHVEY